MVYPDELKNSIEKNYLVVAVRNDETGELNWFPYDDEDEPYVKPYLYLKNLDTKNCEDSFDLNANL